MFTSILRYESLISYKINFTKTWNAPCDFKTTCSKLKRHNFNFCLFLQFHENLKKKVWINFNMQNISQVSQNWYSTELNWSISETQKFFMQNSLTNLIYFYENLWNIFLRAHRISVCNGNIRRNSISEAESGKSEISRKNWFGCCFNVLMTSKHKLDFFAPESCLIESNFKSFLIKF